VKLTPETINTITLPACRVDKVYFDDSLPGFGLRLRASGATSWVVQYDFGNRTRRITIGSTAVFPLAAARTAARKLLAAARLGRDPAAERRAGLHRSLERRVADKALAFLARGVEPACYLYRHYHPNGDLLYAGISLAPLRRQDRHLKAASWRDMICRILIEPFETREQALVAEQLAIRDEFPQFNTAHNKQRHPIQEIDRRDPETV
jgi:Arm DNA-binding domain